MTTFRIILLALTLVTIVLIVIAFLMERNFMKTGKFALRNPFRARRIQWSLTRGNDPVKWIDAKVRGNKFYLPWPAVTALTGGRYKGLPLKLTEDKKGLIQDKSMPGYNKPYPGFSWREVSTAD